MGCSPPHRGLCAQRLHRHPSLLPGVSTGSANRRQPSAPLRIPPGFFPLRLREERERRRNVASGTQAAQRVLPDPLPSASPTPPVVPQPCQPRHPAMLCDSHLPLRMRRAAAARRRSGIAATVAGIGASLCSAGISPGSQCASDRKDVNSWGLEQHQLLRETQMELGFGGVNAEICCCFFKPETSCCEWRDGASVSSRPQNKNMSSPRLC